VQCRFGIIKRGRGLVWVRLKCPRYRPPPERRGNIDATHLATDLTADGPSGSLGRFGPSDRDVHGHPCRQQEIASHQLAGKSRNSNRTARLWPRAGGMTLKRMRGRLRPVRARHSGKQNVGWCGIARPDDRRRHAGVFISTRMPWTVLPDSLCTRPRPCGAMLTIRHPLPSQA